MNITKPPRLLLVDDDDVLRQSLAQRFKRQGMQVGEAASVAEALKLPVNEGLMLERVNPGGPAATAGLRGGDRQAILGMRRILLGGDVVTAIDGRPITGQMDLNLALNRKRPGDTVKVEYYRGGQKMEAQVTLSDASR